MEAQHQPSTSLANHGEYPLNVLRTDSFHHSLEAYRRRLEQAKVFHETSRYFYLWDLKKDANGKALECRGSFFSVLIGLGTRNFVLSANLQTGADVEKYLTSQGEDPLWRFAYASSSLMPLNQLF
jgi:hypothetical protein